MVPEVKALASQVWQPKFGTQLVEAENGHTWKMTSMCMMACLCPPKHKINKLIKNQHQSDIWARGFRNSLLWLLRHCGSYDTVAHGLTSPTTSNPPGASYATAVNGRLAESVPLLSMAWSPWWEWQRGSHEQKLRTWILAPDHCLPVQDEVTKKMRKEKIPDNVVNIPKHEIYLF